MSGDGTRCPPASATSSLEARLTENQLREVIDSLPHLVWTRLAEGPCDYLSRQWLEYTGVPEAEQLGSGWLMQLHADDRDRVKTEWDATVGAGVAFDIEFRVRRADGAHRWFKTRVIPLGDADGKVVKWCGSNIDVEEYKRSKEALEQSEGRLRQAVEELERRVEGPNAELSAANRELEAFSYSVAHDLRAPLRGMNGFAKLLLDDYADKLDALGLDCLHEIQANTRKMGHLIDALLMLSRLARSEMRPERIDVTGLAKTIALELALAEPERQVEFCAEDGLEAELDPGLARVLVGNLLGNAWKFTKNVATAKVELGKTDDGDLHAFFVRDNGAGFDMAYADKLFAPFQRLHSVAEFPGTGIGLATAQRIVRRVGGRIWAEGRPGEGATFHFTVPRLSGATP